jgi:uncharacterized membrane protein
VSDAPSSVLWSKHRVEALTDGIFAVAMTLLVIELKVPDPHTIHSQDELAQALADLAPKALSWLISFFVLATFWIAHHRLFHYVRYVDRRLLWRNLYQLAFVSLMPFSAALLGEFPATTIAEVAYNGNMAILGLLGLWKLLYVRHHPELASHPMEPGTYHASLYRIGGLIAAGVAALILAVWLRTPYATLAYLSMIPFGRYGRHLEHKARTRSASSAANAPVAPPQPASPSNHHP